MYKIIWHNATEREVCTMSDTMHHKILCFGSLNIDHVYSVDHFVAKGETLSSQKLETFTGGKGLNQSVALARAGAETYHAGAIGPDGSFLLDMMKEAGVHTDYVTMIPDVHTGHAIIQRDKEGDNCILLYGGTNQLITKEQTDSVLSHFSTGDYLVLQNEINQLPYIVEKAHALGMTIVLNPSPMNEKVLQLPLDEIDIFLLNEVEAGQILGSHVSEGRALAAALRERFPNATVVLTLGGDGSVCVCSDGTFFQPAYKTHVADTTAAGDTYTGYFLASLLHGSSVADSMKAASAAASIACSRKGAAPSIPAAGEVAAYLDAQGA